ncbi:MAG TPA: ATP-binding protein [Thermoanaerobaculia bacterium]|nr:ATP-binding protein [Thermoanaerobaculia bacterium]
METLAEQELRRRDQVFKALVENTPDLIARFTRDLRRCYVNPAIERLTGLPYSELVGKTLSELNFDQRFSPKIEQALREVFATSSERTLEVFLPTPAGERIYQLRIVPEFTQTGEVEFALVISRDITTIRREEAEHRQLQRELERANQLIGLGRVASAMSHEFNNVLMGIQSFAEVVLRSGQQPRVLDAANRIIQSVERGRAITEELRAFTRPQPPARDRIDVRSWLYTAFPNLESDRVMLEIAVDGTPKIQGDVQQLTQVVANIIANAREAVGSRKGSIRLSASASADGSLVEITVTDDGPGIDPQAMARIFEPFFTTKEGGTGLGLAIAHQAVTLHGGQLSVDQNEPHGTIVRISLPAIGSGEERSTAASPAGTAARSRPERILFVEDDEAVAAGVVALLEDENIVVRRARDGAEALRILRDYEPQALLIDINLPDWNGFDLYDEITSLFGPLPVVFASGHADAARLDKLKTSARVLMLTKPYAIDTLLDALESLGADE